MDLTVCGKLLTHHQRGYGVDVEALHDRFPLQQIAGKGPKMGSRVQKVAAVEKWFHGSLMFLGYSIRVYIGERSTSVELQGAHVGGGHAQGSGRAPYLVASLLLPLHGLQVSRVAFLPKICSVKFQLNWTPFDFPFLRYSKTRKNRNWHWALG